MLSPSVVYSSPPNAVASTSAVRPIFAALWLIDKDFSNTETPVRIPVIPPRVHICVDQRHRQPYDVRIRPLDPRHEPRCQTLDGVGAGLVHRLPARHVPVDLGRRERRKLDRRSPRPRSRTGPGAPVLHEADRRHHLVGPAREQPQHPLRILRPRRLAENLPVDDDGRVGREHGPTGALAADGAGPSTSATRLA